MPVAADVLVEETCGDLPRAGLCLCVVVPYKSARLLKGFGKIVITIKNLCYLKANFHSYCAKVKVVRYQNMQTKKTNTQADTNTRENK